MGNGNSELLDDNCVFCRRIAKGEFMWEDKNAVSFEPLNPVVKGHLLVVPKVHVKDFTECPRVSAETMYLAADLAFSSGRQYNLITSKGPAATQTVFHLHIHLVPRTENDGLWLPWTPQGEK